MAKRIRFIQSGIVLCALLPSLLTSAKQLESARHNEGAVLPWSRPDERPPASQVKGARELLALYQLTSDDLARINGDEEMDDGEASIAARLLYRLARLEPGELASWRQAEADWQAVSQDVQSRRGDIFGIQGSATRVTSFAVPQELRETLDFAEFYVVDVQLDSGEAARILARHVPKAWLAPGILPTPTLADAMLLQASSNSDHRLTFAAGRMGWYPKQPAPDHGVTSSHVHLAKLGVDLGLFDMVRENNGRELLAQDRESFYQVLSAAKQSDTLQLPEAMARQLDLEEILVSPEKHQGELLTFVADVRRINRVEITDPDLRKRYQLDGYYELDITMPIQRPIRLSGNSEKEGPIYEYIFPLTVCVIHLPPELERQASSSQEQQQGSRLLRAHVSFSGYFFKIWTYQSQYVSSFNQQQVHPSPLLVGTTVAFAAYPAAPRNILPAIFATVFIGVLLIGWWVMRRTSMRDRQARRSPENVVIKPPA